MKIKYKEIATFYLNIVYHILNQIDNKYLKERVKENWKPKYSKDSNTAYEYLKKSLNNLNNVCSMEKYYNEETFQYYVLEKLYEIRCHIEHFLNTGNLTVDFSKDDIVQNYTYYDDIIVDYYQPLRLDKNTHSIDWMKYYEERISRDNELKNINRWISELKMELVFFKYEITNCDYITNKNFLNDKINQINELVCELKPNSHKFDDEK